MAEDNSTWEAFAFMKECKKTMPGFDFRMTLDNMIKRPIALVFMFRSSVVNVRTMQRL